MGRIRDKRRFRCLECWAVCLEPELLTAPSPFAETFELVACPACKQSDQSRIVLLCDEELCGNEAGCGWPTGDDSDQWGGYRQTCYKHMVDHGD